MTKTAELDLEKISSRVTAMRQKLPEEGNEWQRLPKAESTVYTSKGTFEFEGHRRHDIKSFYTHDTEIISLNISPFGFTLHISVSRICPPWGERRVNREIHGNYMGRPIKSEQHEWYKQTEQTAEMVDNLLDLTERTIDVYISNDQSQSL